MRLQNGESEAAPLKYNATEGNDRCIFDELVLTLDNQCGIYRSFQISCTTIIVTMCLRDKNHVPKTCIIILFFIVAHRQQKEYLVDLYSRCW